MGNNVITYGPDVLAALIRELDEPITSAITGEGVVRTGDAMTLDLDNLAARREADALDLWRTEGKAPAGICPHCGSTVSVVQRDERYVARCSHRGCGARGPQHSRLTSAVDAFCRPPAYVARHITSPITNPAPIEHGLVMDEWSAMTMQSRLRCLARNLHDAAGCALAWRLHRDFEWNWKHGDCEAWCPNLDGERAPGWER